MPSPSLATFACGCFWGVEETFRNTPGVLDVTVGYTGGTVENPTYEMVCTGTTGHAEAVQVKYDPEKVTYEKLLQVFFDNHNPTTKNRQGPDFGEQYRSVIFTHDDEQKAAAEKIIQDLEAAKRFGKPIVTNVVPAAPFYAAENYHQQYLRKRGLQHCHL